jgi:glycosyltransferase involved in cell wall biosynthesis
MKKLKILFQLPCTLDPIDNGAKQRMMGTLNYFKARQDWFEVDIVASGDWTGPQRDQLAPFAAHVHIYDGRRNWGDAIVSRNFTPPGYRKFVQDLADRQPYDFVWIHYLDFAHLAFVDALQAATKVIDICDIACRIRLARRNIAHLKGLKFDYDQSFRREVKFLQKFDHVLNNSLDELAELEPHLEPRQLTLIPHLLKGLPAADRIPDYAVRKMPYDLLFVGAPYGPNVDGMNFFLAEIFPKIIDRHPTVKLAIVGKVGDALEIPDPLRSHVDCLGFVPDLGAVYLSARMVICPLLSGSGTKVKLQEAMAYGVPIVTTGVGASGLALQDGVNADIQDKPEAFAAAVVNLLQDGAMARQYSHNVLQTFQEGYTERVIYARLDQIFGLQTSPIGLPQWTTL